MKGSFSLLSSKKLLECVECTRRFSLRDIADGFYWPIAGVCMNCYLFLAKNSRYCFAKQFDPDHVDCSKFCPDRGVCGVLSARIERGILEI